MGNSNGIMNESPIPLYYQIYVDLKNKLLINKLVDENGKLPAEKELAESYKVSRVTMRQAIAELEKDGLIVRYRGRGSFLKSQPNPILHKLGLPGQAGRVQIDKSPEIVELSHFDTTYEYIGRALNYEGDIFFIKRIFRVDGNPVAINRIWIPAVFTPELDKKGLCVEGSLSKTLKEVYHLKIDRRENVIEAVRPSVSDIELLKITYDTLILQITSKSFLKDNFTVRVFRHLLDWRCHQAGGGCGRHRTRYYIFEIKNPADVYSAGIFCCRGSIIKSGGFWNE